MQPYTTRGGTWGVVGHGLRLGAEWGCEDWLGHGLLGGSFSMSQGGDFGTGFVAGLCSSAAGYGTSQIKSGFFTTRIGSTLLSAGTGAASSAMTGGDPWMGAAIGAIGYATNQAMHKKVASLMKQAKMMAGLAVQFEIGNGNPYFINAEELDFSQTSMKKLGIDDMKVGETREVSLFNGGNIDGNSLSFGVVSLTYRGADYFSIGHNTFDFDYQPTSSNARNAATFIGGAIFGRFFNHVPTLTFPFLRPNYFIGGPFEVYFNGYAHIKR